LLLDCGDLVAPFLWFCFDYTDRFLADKKNVVGRTDIGPILTDGDP